MILSTLDIKFFKKQALVYFVISIFVFVFGCVYKLFSHDVNSNFMKFAFVIPLLFGTMVSFLIYIFKVKNFQNRVCINTYNASIATFTTYFIVKGVLDIYGTTNKLINIYLITGLILFLISANVFIRKH